MYVHCIHAFLMKLNLRVYTYIPFVPAYQRYIEFNQIFVHIFVYKLCAYDRGKLSVSLNS